MITKMWRAMALPSSSDKSPQGGATLHRIDRLHNADKFRVVYTIQQPRAVEVSAKDLHQDFDNAIRMAVSIIKADHGLDVDPPEIEIETSLEWMEKIVDV